jgi:hypothetical protein
MPAINFYKMNRTINTIIVKIIRTKWAIVFSLALVLGAVRLFQTAWFLTPPADLITLEYAKALFQGFRFDLKTGAIFAALLIPLRFLVTEKLFRVFSVIFAAVVFLFSVINFHFISFYKEPINVIFFGLIEDDTTAILQTIWRDFPVITSLAIIGALSIFQHFIQQWIEELMTSFFEEIRTPILLAIFAFSTAFFLLLGKGTIRGMALGQQHVSVTASQFLNNVVPNGVTAFRFAWSNWRESHDLDNVDAGLRRLGFNSPDEALKVLTAAEHPLAHADFSLDHADAVHIGGSKKKI